MYVCVCHAVTETHIRQAAEAGVTSFTELQQRLAIATGCGSCESCAREVFERARAAARATAPRAAETFARLTPNASDSNLNRSHFL